MLSRLESIEERYKEIEELLADPNISGDYSRSQNLIKEHASLKHLAALSAQYRHITGDLEEAINLSKDGSDQDIALLAKEEIPDLENQLGRVEHKLRVALLPKDENDNRNVIMEIRAGTGGDEAGLFAADLYRMYFRCSQRRGWKIDVVNSNETGTGSIKEIVFMVKGDGAYSYLKHESGGHRVQRIPVTESSGRIHTSAATVAVLPEAEEVDVEIKSDDIQIDIFHSSGHGGQNVQKVATAVRITHSATGIVAVCQDERSQHKNKEKAMSVLRSRLFDLELRRQQQERSEARRSQVGSGDRSERVRTYNFPQSRVTDHRVGLTSHSLESILDGDLDEFTESLKSREQAQKLEEAGL